MKTGNCFRKKVDLFDLVVAEVTDFDLTRNKVYIVKGTTDASLIQVRNDKGEKDYYTTEHFRFYEGETIGI